MHADFLKRFRVASALAPEARTEYVHNPASGVRSVFFFFRSRVRQPELHVHSLLRKWWLQGVSLQTLCQTTMFDIVRCGEFDSDVECTRGNIDVLKNDFTNLGKSMSPIWITSAAVSTWTTSTCGTTRHPSQTEATSWSWRAPAPNSFLFTALGQHCNGSHCFAKISNTFRWPPFAVDLLQFSPRSSGLVEISITRNMRRPWLLLDTTTSIPKLF